MAAAAETTAPTTSTIGADEIALYDRQIRLWGVQAQQKIRNAHILLVNVKALGNEVAKNLVLAGIASLTLVDNGIVTEDDLCAQFFLTEADIGQPRAQAAAVNIRKINPRVHITVEPRDLATLLASTTTAAAPYLSAFAAAIATDLPVAHTHTLNAAARLCGCPFYAAGAHGLYGFIFADLIAHTFTVTRERPTAAGAPASRPGAVESLTRHVVAVAASRGDDDDGRTVELLTKRETYQPFILANTSPLSAEILRFPRRLRRVTPLLPCLRALWEFETLHARGPSPQSVDDLREFTTLATAAARELALPLDVLRSDFLRSFMQNAYAELAPVTAVLGGRLAQDVINVLGAREQPIQNLLLFDGDASVAPIFALCPMITTADVALVGGPMI